MKKQVIGMGAASMRAPWEYLCRICGGDRDAVLTWGLPRPNDRVTGARQQVYVSWRDLQQQIALHCAAEQSLAVGQEAG